MAIITDHKWKTLLNWCDLTDDEQCEFDWIPEGSEDDFSFFRYRNWPYCTANFEKSSIPGWDGMSADTFFSGVLIKFNPHNSNEYMAGTYIG